MAHHRAGPDRYYPLWRRVMANEWTDEKREEWEERAAIMEYLGEMTRADAELAAWRVVAAR